MKKLLGIIFLILVFAIACVSAGNLVSHDFGNFTADIPADSNFVGYTQTVLHNMDSRYLSASSVQSAMDSSSDVYSSFEDKKHNISIEILNTSANGNYSNHIDSDAEKLETDNGLICFNESTPSETLYCVIKEQPGFLFWPGDKYVKIEGPDLELLKEMGKTVEFK